MGKAAGMVGRGGMRAWASVELHLQSSPPHAQHQRESPYDKEYQGHIQLSRGWADNYRITCAYLASSISLLLLGRSDTDSG